MHLPSAVTKSCFLQWLSKWLKGFKSANIRYFLLPLGFSKDNLRSLCCPNPSPQLFFSWEWLSTCYGRWWMSGMEAAVPCSLSEEKGCFEQEEFGDRGKIPLLETSNILRRTKHSPQLLYGKVPGNSLISSLLLSGLCRTQFPQTAENSNQERPQVFEVNVSKLHPEKALLGLHKQKAMSCL